MVAVEEISYRYSCDRGEDTSMAMFAFPPVDSPLPSALGAALAVGEDVVVSELEDDAVRLTELVTMNKEVDVGVTVVPI